MACELIELSTANVVGAYESKADALRDVVDSIRRYGRQRVATLALGRDDLADGPCREIARGDGLADLALGPAAV